MCWLARRPQGRAKGRGQSRRPISENGYSNLVKRASNDSELAEAVAQRADIPGHLFREFCCARPKWCSSRLLAAAKPETQAEIRRVLAKVSDEVAASAKPKRDLSARRENGARGRGRRNARRGDGGVLRQAAGQYDETVAALAELCRRADRCGRPLMNGERPDPVPDPVQGGGLFLADRARHHPRAPGSRGKVDARMEAASANFDKLSASTAKRVVRFWQVGQIRTDSAIVAKLCVR